MPKFTDKKKASNKKWDSHNLERLSVVFRAGELDTIRQAAQIAGSSVNGFCRETLVKAAESIIAAAGETQAQNGETPENALQDAEKA